MTDGASPAAVGMWQAGVGTALRNPNRLQSRASGHSPASERPGDRMPAAARAEPAGTALPRLAWALGRAELQAPCSACAVHSPAEPVRMNDLPSLLRVRRFLAPATEPPQVQSSPLEKEFATTPPCSAHCDSWDCAGLASCVAPQRPAPVPDLDVCQQWAPLCMTTWSSRTSISTRTPRPSTTPARAATGSSSPW